MSAKRKSKPLTRIKEAAPKRAKPIVVPVLLQDPLEATRTNNYIGLREIELSGQWSIGPGPTSARLAVVDYDETRDVTHDPVEPLTRGGGFAVGSRENLLGNYKLHQAHVWGSIQNVLEMLESSSLLGRSIPWSFGTGRLTVYPHSAEADNPYYDRDTQSLYFPYFDREDTGERFYTCLSHDLIVHELGHAILDGLKPFYYEDSSPDTAGFHEYFGDALSMAVALSWRPIVVHVARDIGEDLTGEDIVARIASEFGAAFQGDESLAFMRTGATRRTMRSLEDNWEEHDYSEVLTGAFYDVLNGIYSTVSVPRRRRKTGLRRLGWRDRVTALIEAASHTSRMMLRGIDYCSPVDVPYIDYARAVIRADEVAYPVDALGYRDILRRVFKKRRIGRTNDDFDTPKALKNSEFKLLEIDTIASSPTQAGQFVDANRDLLGVPWDADINVTNLYRTKKISSDGYHAPREVVIEFVWSAPLPVPNSKRYGTVRGSEWTLWSGGTLVFDDAGNLLHYVLQGETSARAKRLLAYIRHLVEHGYFDPEDEEEPRMQAVRHGGRLAIRRNPRRRHAGRRR